MQLHLIQDTFYRYAQIDSLIIQALRLWPTSNGEQTISDWQVIVDGKQQRFGCKDGFGNPLATHTIDTRSESVRISIQGRVQTFERQGVHMGEEMLPPVFYLAGTPLTAADPEIIDASRARMGEGNGLDSVRRLVSSIGGLMTYRTVDTAAEISAAQAFAARAGGSQDHAHVLISAARSMNFPARYVSGFVYSPDNEAVACHAWAEIFVGESGWVGFDAVHDKNPDEHYVRIACGRDAHDAAPVRAVFHGGLAQPLEVTVRSGKHGPSAQSQSSSGQSQRQ